MAGKLISSSETDIWVLPCSVRHKKQGGYISQVMGALVPVMEIDEEKIYEGSLKEDWELSAPKEISEPDDKQPSDWVDDSMMEDPEEKKPDDWTDEKRMIDEEEKKPDDWG